jgi:acyl carrier protein
MTSIDVRDAVLKALAKVAPETRGLTIAGAVPLRDELDLDSMDMLNFVIGLHTALAVDIPEADYGQLATLDGAVAYLQARLASR